MNGMLLLRTGLIAAVGAGLLLTRFWAGEEKGTVKARGKLAQVDPLGRSLALEVDPAGELLTYHWDESTRFFNNDGTIRSDDLRVGQKVLIVGTDKQAAALTRVEVEPVYEEDQTAAG